MSDAIATKGGGPKIRQRRLGAFSDRVRSIIIAIYGPGIETVAWDSRVRMPDWPARNLNSVVWCREGGFSPAIGRLPLARLGVLISPSSRKDESAPITVIALSPPVPFHLGKVMSSKRTLTRS